MVACCGMRRVGSSVPWIPCPGAATVVRRAICAFTEDWEKTSSKLESPGVYRMLAAKYLGLPDGPAARLRDDDDPDSICEGVIEYVKWGTTLGEWEVFVRRDDTCELATYRVSDLAHYVANALHDQPDGLELQFDEVGVDGDDDVPRGGGGGEEEDEEEEEEEEPGAADGAAGSVAPPK
mmetsp:Transcript_14030/g.48669  ORF Transcript_14030/g.48669 Transcript_14030/m.48669 type:complete len:179 (-) Transcript_14030:173-709(-)